MAKVQSSVRWAAPSRELVLTNDGRLVTDDAATMASSEPESMTESPHLWRGDPASPYINGDGYPDGAPVPERSLDPSGCSWLSGSETGA